MDKGSNLEVKVVGNPYNFSVSSSTNPLRKVCTINNLKKGAAYIFIGVGGTTANNWNISFSEWNPAELYSKNISMNSYNITTVTYLISSSDSVSFTATVHSSSSDKRIYVYTYEISV